MKKIIKLTALFISILLLVQALPVSALEDVTAETEVSSEELFEELFEETEAEEEKVDPETEALPAESDGGGESDSVPDDSETALAEAETEPDDTAAEEKGAVEYEDGDTQTYTYEEHDMGADILGELAGDRSANVKKFRMSDGTVCVATYPVDVHFKDEEGNFVQIDNSPEDITEDGREAVDAVKENVFDASFFKKVDDGSIFAAEFGGVRIGASLEGAEDASLEEVKIEAKGGLFDVPNIAGTYLYRDILENVDIRYTVVSTLIKENVILKDKPGDDHITYVYRTEGEAELRQTEDGIDVVRKDTDEVVASLKAPVMWDAAGEIDHGVRLESNKVEDGVYEITLSWNGEWTSSEERVYPVTVDPVITTQITYSGATSDIDDAFARELSYSEPANWEILRVGRTDATYRTRSVIKVHPENYVPKNANIIYASINLIPFIFDWGGYTTPFVNDFANQPIVNLHRMTANWNEETFCWNTLWSTNAANGYNGDVVDYVKIGNYDPSTSTYIPSYTWDITKVANGWINGTYPNYGIMLKYLNESATGSMFFASSDWIYADQYISAAARPRALFQYLDTNGTEDYYSAHSLGAGRAGTAYINDMTGNLTVANTVLSLGNGPAPINLALIYNSNDSSEAQSWPLGKGWRFNYGQKVELTNIAQDGRRYFKYTDADGTAHYYLENSAGGYSSTDETDQKNTLTYNSSNYEFKLSRENSGTKAYFKKSGSVWYLDRIEDDYGNKVSVNYSTSSHDMITKLISTDGYTVDFTYNTYSYLTSVKYTDITTKTVTFGYGGGSALSSITFEDGKSAAYTYYSGTYKLQSMSDTDGYKFEFTYTGGSALSPLRVAGVTEKGTDGSTGQKMTMSYGVKSMTLTDVTNGRKYLYAFSSLGTLTSIADITDNDKACDAVYFEYNNKIPIQLNKGNLTFASQTQKSTVNIMNGHSFESASGQTFTVWGTNGSPVAGASYSTSKAYLGTHSVKLDRPAGNNSERVLSYATANLTAGKEYTFSAYVNTSEMTFVTKGASLFIYYSSGGNTYSFESEAVTETTGAGEWKRIFVTFVPEYSGYVSACLSLSGATGSVYFDCIQLEEGGLSDYNLLENAGFDSSSAGWTYPYSGTSSYSSTGGFPGGCGKLSGGPAVRPHIYQTLNVSGQKGDVYVASAMSRAISASPSHGEYKMLVRFYNGNTTVNTVSVSFNPNTDSWHKTACQAIAGGTYTKLCVFLLNYNGTNSAYFDNVTLTKDFFGNTYTYDSKGNVKSTADLANSEENTFTYDGKSHLIKQTNISGSKIEYTYNGTKTHQLDSVLAKGITTTFTYDNYGNVVTSASTNGSQTVYGGAAYNERGEMTASVDSLGNTVSYLYKERLVDEATDASGAKVKYEYNSSRLPTKSTFTKGAETAEVTYGYNSNNYLSTLTAPGGTVYGFTYDAFGRKLSTTVGNTALSTNTYNSRGLLTGTAYGNGFTHTFAYDYLNRLKSESSGGSVTVSYNYDGKGRISEKKDFLSGRTTKNGYDLLDRISTVDTIDDSTNNVIQSTKINYDDKNRVSGVDYGYLGAVRSTEYLYGAGTNEPSVIYGVSLDNSEEISYTYDGLFRRTERVLPGANGFTTSYTYSSGKRVANGGFWSSSYEGRCVSGDFNGDGYSDLALMYSYSSAHCKIFVWLADGNGGYLNQIEAYEDTAYDASKASYTMCSGDFDGDGCDEIAAFYDLGGASFELQVFDQTSYSNTDIAFCKEIWYTANGTFSSLNVKYRVSAGDYDGDGCDEIAAMYFYTDLSMKIFVFDPAESGGEWSMNGSPWYSAGAGTFDADRVTGRFVSGDFDGDGCDEIAAMYDNGGSSMTTYVFGKDSGGNVFTRETWLTAAAGVFDAGNVEGTLVAGNFVGDSKADLAMVYNYPSCEKILVCESQGTVFAHWYQKHNGNGNYTFEGMQYRVFGGSVDGSGYDEIAAMYRQGACAFSIYKFTNTGEDGFAFENSVWNSQAIVRENAGAATTRISGETIGNDTYTYTYDALGNVTEIRKNSQPYRSYEYDALGEMIREDIYGDRTYVYTYDAGGNILTKKQYPYTSPNSAPTGAGSTVGSYTYSTGDWGDILVSYNNCPIQYDEIGNPTEYYTLDSYTWTEGRRLGEISMGGWSETFTYDSNGIRTSKTVNGVTHKYYLDGSKIICEESSDGTVLHFFYDESGNLFALEKDGAKYYYVRNILGEIIGLIDSNGSYVAKYSYDAWGNPIDIKNGSGVSVYGNSSHIANVNPFRYKGYYYDSEVGLYYLQSRYYDPYTGRFLNADGTVSTETGIMGYNMFAYCNNSPVLLKDSSGLRPILCAPDEEETDEQRKESFAMMKIYVKSRSIKIDSQLISNNIASNSPISKKDFLNDKEKLHNAEIINNYLIRQGWSVNAICAVLGNMDAESGLNPGITELGGDGGFGLCQWTASPDFYDWMYNNGYPYDNLYGQLGFLIYSMKPGAGRWFDNGSGYYMPYDEFIYSSADVEYLAMVFQFSYERGVGSEARVEAAKKWWGIYGY